MKKFANEKVAVLSTKKSCDTFVFLLICSAAPLIISICYMAFYWILVAQSKAFNERLEMGDNAFNMCGPTGRSIGPPIGPFANNSNIAETDTKWTTVFYFNAIIYSLLFAGIILLLISAFFWRIALIGTCTLCWS